VFRISRDCYKSDVAHRVATG